MGEERMSQMESFSPYKDGLHGLHLLGLGLWKMTNGTKRSQDITYLSVFHPKTIVFWLLGKNYKDFK